jgi:hypothetical protein
MIYHACRGQRKVQLSILGFFSFSQFGWLASEAKHYLANHITHKKCNKNLPPMNNNKCWPFWKNLTLIDYQPGLDHQANDDEV